MNIVFMVEAMFRLIPGTHSPAGTARCLSPAGQDVLTGRCIIAPQMTEAGDSG
jgi:hypothetical protein